jgi:hypothetical protein
MTALLSSAKRRIGFGIVILAWTTFQFLLVARSLEFASRVGLGIQTGIAAALIYSGLAHHRHRHA